MSSAVSFFSAGVPTPSSAAIHADNEHTVGKLLLGRHQRTRNRSAIGANEHAGER